MYRIYSTEGLILRSRDVGEASKVLSLFTKELGLIHARAQGVREGRSKLRYHLQDFSLASFDLVRGKNGWRVTGARDAENLALFPITEKENAALSILISISSLLTRLLHGEEKNIELYSDVVSSFMILQSATVESEFLK